MAGISQTRWKAYSPAQPQTSGYSVSVPDYPEPADPISTLQLQHTSPAPPTARFSNTPSVAQAPGSSHQSASRQTTTPTTSAPTHTGQQKFSIVKYSKRLHEGEPAKVPSAAREHVKKKPAPQGQKYTTSAALIAQVCTISVLSILRFGCTFIEYMLFHFISIGNGSLMLTRTECHGW